MQNQEIFKQLQRLNILFKRITTISGTDIEMQSHWAKYLCVLCAGFIENALKEIYGEFVSGAAHKPVADYANSILAKIQNPKTNRFIETARAFKVGWATDLEHFVNQNGRREAIDSIMANRHLIAHGKQSGITLTRAKEYLEKAVEVIDFIETQCKS